MPIDMEQLDALRQKHLGRLLLKSYRAFSSRAQEKLQQCGYTDLALAHTVLLTNIDVQGTRPALLAERIGVSRQAVGNLLDDLESKGYISRTADLVDHRATIVSLTAAGWKLLQDVVKVKMDIEDELSEILGAEQMLMLRSLLTKLLQYYEGTD